MSYMFLSFEEHLEKQNRQKGDFYTESLKDQYLRLAKRVPDRYRLAKLDDFIEKLFPTDILNEYFFSCPNFLRERHENDTGKTYLNNVVIRPTKTLSSAKYMPENQNIILVGDISDNGKYKIFEVKGMEFIDDSMKSDRDMVVKAKAVSSFGYVSSPNGSKYKAWTIDRVNHDETLFTPDFVNELINKCFTVDDVMKVRKSYDEWEKYFDFRDYYLDEQSKRNFKLDSAKYIKSYAVNRKEYRSKSVVYDEYILDGRDELKNGEMIVLSEKVENAEEFPLVRLIIDRNRKEFLDNRVLRRGRLVNEEERKIRSLASDNVFITAVDPASKSKYPNRDKVDISEMLPQGYELGDRFKVISYDVEPAEHIEELNRKCAQDTDSAYKSIDSKYKKIIGDELNKYIAIEQKKIDDENEAQLREAEDSSNSSLDEEVKNNTDEEIINKVESIKRANKRNIQSATKIEKGESNEAFSIRLNRLIEEENSKIDIRELYVERNEKRLADLGRKLQREGNNKLDRKRKEKNQELENKYKEDIRLEKTNAKANLDEALRKDTEKAIEDETIKRFALYFRLGDPNGSIKEKQIKQIANCQYIVYDNRAELSKIKRQKTALDNFYQGYVKNPYLSTYLFAPETLPPVSSTVEPNWTWYLESLNEKQKEAVRKAVASNGIFLLQGPPGTGKTQVIAETVAHLVKSGKKVLISSETHKAIDNVFERLPKIAEIVPVRLIPSNNDKKKDNEYDPGKLVDNFYSNIASTMSRSINRYRNFEKNKEEFNEKYKTLAILKSKIDKSQATLDKSIEEIKEKESRAKIINDKISALKDKESESRIALDILNRTQRHIDKNSFQLDDDIDNEIIIELRKTIEAYIDSSVYLYEENSDLGTFVRNVFNLSNEQIIQELSIIDPSSNQTKRKIELNDLKHKRSLLEDESGDPLPGKEDEHKAVKDEIKRLINERNSSQSADNLDIKLNKIFNYSYLVSNISTIKDALDNLKDQIREAKADAIAKLNPKITEVEKKSNEIKSEIAHLSLDIKEINNEIQNIYDKDDVKSIQNDKDKLESNISKFFKEFEIAEPYTDIDAALRIIKIKWDELETNFDKTAKENQEKIPMYEKISKYISSDDILEEDRKAFTKDLFESANVFGITCTSNDRFREGKIDSLSEFNLGDINLKSVGIDVVIIDEVSKSSFIDLLIPILYGKTVILVGDHRQLPPMYEFSKLRKDDFENLDEEKITPELNAKFTKMYEECFFKTLFEKIPEDYKIMLVQQYRCHEHIMNVFNHFYQGELKMGFNGQNNEKKHGATIISNGRTIIEPSEHVYFVDCKQNETHEEDSTSMFNMGEARVVAELVRKLNDFYKAHPEKERLSIGIISTYGDQAAKIKSELKARKVKHDAFLEPEKITVSTVDDFQGDEKDIIILSMVRNPEKPEKSNPGFILAYQRINVALSRARRLLIVVGNRKYLENKGVIDLPDVYGRKDKDQPRFRVYEEIIHTIEQYGKVIEDVDVLPEKEERING